MNEIPNLTTGHVPDPIDKRDFQAVSVMAAPVIDWTKEFRLTAPKDYDQGSADECVACSSSYYHEHLTGPVYSKRDLFSRIALSYGAYIRDGVLEIVKNGQCTEADAPDTIPATPANSRDARGIDVTKRAAHKERQAFALPNTQMDYLADAIKTYGGFVFGVVGTNSGWFASKDKMLVPDWPQMGSSEETWGHALYAMGYHTHTNSNGSKEKCIIAKSSWCNYAQEHHIRERYFFTGNTNSAWVLIPKNMNQAKVVKSKNSNTVYICYPMSKMDLLADRANLEGISYDPANIPNTDTL